ncbi:hypothetical protein [Haloarcula nitratireducens]|uniref:hypothetical protein n=1 Tax=Haloarcula nitratireducens TaxID=2487749 RepID=UPI002E2B744A|nr:hypothetical protein [Halomicroarcula nitratireducens]
MFITPQSLEGILIADDVIRLFRNPRTVDFEPLVVVSPAADRLVDAALERNRVSIAIVEESNFRMEDLPIVRGRAWIGDLDVDPALAEETRENTEVRI